MTDNDNVQSLPSFEFHLPYHIFMLFQHLKNIFFFYFDFIFSNVTIIFEFFISCAKMITNQAPPRPTLHSDFLGSLIDGGN